MPTDAETEVASVAHPALHRRSEIPLPQNVDDTHHRGVVQYLAAEGPREVSPHDLTLAVGAEVEATAVVAVGVAQAVRPQTASPKKARSMEGADGGLQEGSRPKAGDEIALRLPHDPGFETSQLMFLKMNLVRRRPKLKQKWPPNEVPEVSFGCRSAETGGQRR